MKKLLSDRVVELVTVVYLTLLSVYNIITNPEANMATTQFISCNSFKNVNGTSNLMCLLDPQLQTKIRSFDPMEVEETFGSGIQGPYEPTRGYEDDEWYWLSSKGHVWGIGWRWGQARLRGKGRPGSRPDAQDAAEFVAFLEREILV